jgi:putative exporter of polyketide antibiotics
MELVDVRSDEPYVEDITLKLKRNWLQLVVWKLCMMWAFFCFLHL